MNPDELTPLKLLIRGSGVNNLALVLDHDPRGSSYGWLSVARNRSASVLASYGLIMEYDPLGPVPRYQQIAGILRSRIEVGELEPDRPIPSETAIQQEFGVARATARHAVELLREWGLVVTVPGMGTYVRRR